MWLPLHWKIRHLWRFTVMPRQSGNKGLMTKSLSSVVWHILWEIFGCPAWQLSSISGVTGNHNYLRSPQALQQGDFGSPVWSFCPASHFFFPRAELMGPKATFVSNRRKKREKWTWEDRKSNFFTRPEPCHTLAPSWLGLCKSRKGSRFWSPHLQTGHRKGSKWKDHPKEIRSDSIFYYKLGLHIHFYFDYKWQKRT